MKLRRTAALFALVVAPTAAIAQGGFDLVGFAGVEADGRSTTTGGEGGQTVTV